MAESDLSITLDELNTRISEACRYGRTYSSLDATKQDRVDQYRNEGLRQFYAERPWGFLRPISRLNCVVGQWVYDLPDDFGAMVGRLTYEPDYISRPVELRSEELIRARRQTHSTNAVPQFAATRWKGTDQSVGQRMELLLWPTPDSDYVLTYRYAVLPKGLLDGSREYPYGGMAHGQSILYACLMAVERSPLGDRSGTYAEAYARALLKSVEADSRNQPDSLGPNTDGGLSEDRTTRIARVYYEKDGVRYPADLSLIHI